MTVVRAGVNINGFMAWWSLHRKCSPITPARTLVALLEVMTMPRITDVSVKAIDLRTLKLRSLEHDHEEKESLNIKKAGSHSMSPVDIQNLM
jgi:hypothetical protein